MTDDAPRRLLDLDRVRETIRPARQLSMVWTGGNYTEDPYPIWHELREQAPVHPGTCTQLIGRRRGPICFHGLPYPDRPHFSAFSWAACDAAYRDPETFASSAEAVDLEAGEPSPTNSMLSMGGTQHRRYRALVQPSFVPAKAQWWIENWIEKTVHALIDILREGGRAELNVEFCAAIPVLTITGSFGVPVEQALDIRESLGAARTDHRDHRADRGGPAGAAGQDDLISVLVEAEITDEDGDHASAHRRRDLLVRPAAAGGRLGHHVEADGHHADRSAVHAPMSSTPCGPTASLLRPAIEETMRWMPTDPMFSRWVTADIDFFGVAPPEGSVLHICLGAGQPGPGALGTSRRVRLFSPAQADARLRRRPARLPRAARRPGRDDRRHQRPA